MGVGPWMLAVYAPEFDQMASGGASMRSSLLADGSEETSKTQDE
jgi:hypothetical protein